MQHTSHTPATAFIGTSLLACGPLGTVALAVRAVSTSTESILVLDDRTGKVIDLDLRGSDQDILGRLPPPSGPSSDADAATTTTGSRGRGRPRMGVVAREVTLLPRHWEWLSEQTGGASVALRKLVEEARRATPNKARQRQAQEAAYGAMSALAGNLPGFEEASRALFANDASRLAELLSAWPRDLASYVQGLARGSAVNQ